MTSAPTETLDELTSRMTAYRERATAARRLAEAITDKRATTGLIEHAAEFEKKAEEIATQIVSLADSLADSGDLAAASAPAPRKI